MKVVLIREIGLFDDEGVLIAIANCPETYKAPVAGRQGRTQTIRLVLIVVGGLSNTEN
jgi:phage-related tail fiber protein